jgi:DNA-binding response OmpR family regulator
MDLPEANTVLIVDDEASLRYFLNEELEEEGYQVYTAADGLEALALLQQTPVDLAIIDLQMPGLNGLELMAAIQDLADVPELIMLTAHATLETSIEAMRRGSTDFLLKPCDVNELLDSVERAMVRRRKKLQQKMAASLLADSLGLGSREGQAASEESTATVIAPSVSPSSHPSLPGFSARGLILDMTTMTATKNDQLLSLTPTEFRLLAILMKYPNHLHTFQELAEVTHAQQVDPFQARDLLKSHIGRLRQKLGQTPDGKPYIINARGVGYKFVSDEAEPGDGSQ